MKKIKLYNKISRQGIEAFPKEYYEVGAAVDSPDGIMVRSAVIGEDELCGSLLAISRAGAGVNNIPIAECSRRGIVVFNTPGANANAVKELAVCALMLASRDVVGGIGWVEGLSEADEVASLVEREKARFAGGEILGKTLGVIGLGAIGGMVANTARTLGMRVVGYDPHLTVEAAWSLSRSVNNATDLYELCRDADYISLHVPSNSSTRGMINADLISHMKDGVRIINLSRADLVNAEDMKSALESGKVAKYVTDFPTNDTISFKNTINIPHLGASTAESEETSAKMAAEELKDFLETGNIRNSVNFPQVSIPHFGANRVCIIHLNVANMLSQITSAISSGGINIENLSNGSRGDYAYTIVEMDRDLPCDILPRISAIEGVIRVRTIPSGAASSIR